LLGRATCLPAGPVALAIRRRGGVGRVGPLLLGALLRLRLALLLQALEVFLARSLHAAERVHHRGLDALERDLEEREAFTLVLLLRVALAVASQADAVAEVIHRREVLDPLAVDLLE